MKVNKLNESQEASVARILSSKNYPRGFKWLSNNGTSGEVNFNGVDYAFRKLDDGSYKVMTSADAGWNWSETLFKDESLHENINGFVKTRCSECGKVNRVEVNFPEYNKPFEDTKYTCSECGTENLLHDNHEYNNDGTLKEDFETNVDVILFNSYGQEIDRRTFSEDGLKDGFRVMMAKDEWEFQPGDTIRFEYTEHEYDEYDESMNEGILTEGKWSHKVPDEMAKDLRKAINDDNYEVVITTLISIYNYLQDILPEDYDNFIDYAIEDLEFLDISPDADEDEMEEFYDDLNYNLDRFYDFCDDLKIWIPV